MSMSEKMFGQNIPAGTTAVTNYTVPAGKTGILRSIFCANVSGSNADLVIYVDNVGATYDSTTTVLAATKVAAGATVEFSGYMAIAAGGTVGVKTSTSASVNFTSFGLEIDV